MIFYISSYCNFFYLAFLIIGSNNVFISIIGSNNVFISIIGSNNVFISIVGLLNTLLQLNICTTSLRWLILQCSSLSIILTLFPKDRLFPFSFYIWLAISNYFLFHLDILLFDVPLALLLVSSMSCLWVLYYNCMRWNTHNSSCW